MRVYFVLFATCLGLISQAFSMDRVSLNEEHFFLTHKTSFFPNNGLMIPGARLPRNGHYEIVNEKDAPNLRLTLHWFGMKMHVAHEKNTNEDDRYLLIERASSLFPSLYGGYHEDFVVIGPHILSEFSYALVPLNEMDELQHKHPLFKGKWVGYEGDLFSFSESFLTDTLGCPQIDILSDTHTIPLTPEQYKAVQGILAVDPSLKERLSYQDGHYYLTEELIPEHQKILVNGTKVLAKEYFLPLLPQNFTWKSHIEMIFRNFEIMGNALFYGVLELFQLKSVSIATYIPSADIAATLEHYEKMIIPSVKMAINGLDLPQASQGYIKARLKNINTWLSIPRKQIKDVEQQCTVLGVSNKAKAWVEAMTFGGFQRYESMNRPDVMNYAMGLIQKTIYGNHEKLRLEIARLEKSIICTSSLLI